MKAVQAMLMLLAVVSSVHEYSWLDRLRASGLTAHLAQKDL